VADGTLPCGVSRRTFLKSFAAASAAVAGSTLLPGGDALLHAESVPPVTPDWRPVPCHLCPARCGLLVGIEGGRAVAVKGDPRSPLSRGTACARGYHAAEGLYGGDRITQPMLRKDGVLRPVALTEALDVVAARLKDSIARSGPRSVALFRSADWVQPDADVAGALFGEAIGTPNIDSTLRWESASAVAGLRSTYGSPDPVARYEDLDAADVFVVWNSNLAESDPVVFSRILERRRENRAVRIINLSTRGTRTSWAADRSLTIAPHSEVAIANAIAQDIVQSGKVRKGFVDSHVSFRRGLTSIGYGLEGEAVTADRPNDASWPEYVRFLADYTPAKVERISGVASPDIRWLASLYADPTRKVVSVWGAELNAHCRGTWVNNVIHNLHLLTGKIGTAGNGPLCVSAAGDPGGGRDVISILRSAAAGDVRFLWVQGADPLGRLPQPRRHAAALSDPRCFVVASAAYPTATTAVADVVLPTALWFEREGFIADAGGRLRRVDRLVTARPGVTSEVAQMIEIARRTGHDSRVARATPAQRSAEAGDSRRPYNTALDPRADRKRGDFDFHGNADHRATIWLRPHQPAPETPDASYPFWLETGQVLEHGDGDPSTRRARALHRAMPRAYVEMNPDDADRLGVRTGEMVRVVSRRGAVRLPARVDHRSQPLPGQLFVPSFDDQAVINSIMLDACCPLSGQPERGKCAVRVEKAT
jgi:nitrate reductase (cytochrome)